MRKFAALFALLLSACTQGPAYRCFDGALYVKYASEQPWQAVDAAPSHAGFTPQPCMDN